jgi:hypothetical protein
MKLRFKTKVINKPSFLLYDKGKLVTWYYLYVKKYWFSIIWRKCGYGSLSQKENEEKMKQYESGECKIPDLYVVRQLKRVPDIFNAIVLCLKYPFLYPRNRFTGKHYNNWKLIDYITTINGKAFILIPDLNNQFKFSKKIRSIKYSIWYFILVTINKYILPVFHCIPTYTELCSMPEGWRKSFGVQMCKDIKQALLKTSKQALYSYRILQIKEKYGELRWYDANATHDVYAVILKYEELSRNTCIVCGESAKYTTTSWISPYCEKHLPQRDKDCRTYNIIK